jgi:hypothetical protein
MRTTLIINDELLRAAKSLAAERQCSLSAVINDALRLSLKPAGRSHEAPTFRMPRYRGEGPPVDSSSGELAELRDSEELTPFSQ